MRWNATANYCILSVWLALWGDLAAAQDAVSQVRARVQLAAAAQESVVPGQPGWLFFTPELRSVSVGPFWGTQAPLVSRARKPEWADPLPAIVDYQQQLQARGIDLLLVPVPPKVVIYPASLFATAPTAADLAAIVATQQEFYALLREAGVPVLDLTAAFRAAPAEPLLYCRTDTHWSGAGCVLAARVIAAEIQKLPVGKTLPTPVTPFQLQTQPITFTGDLCSLSQPPLTTRETLTVTTVRRGGAALAPDRASPILVLGDSHTLVFHDPQLHAEGAGLVDHLAEQLGHPVDLLGVRGSGGHAARVNLNLRPKALVGKKLLVWCFTAREFTESSDGWRTVKLKAAP